MFEDFNLEDSTNDTPVAVPHGSQKALDSIKADLEKFTTGIKIILKKQNNEIEKLGGSTSQTAKELSEWEEKYDGSLKELEGIKSTIDTLQKQQGRHIEVEDRSNYDFKSLGEYVISQKVHEQLGIEKMQNSKRLGFKGFLGKKSRAGIPILVFEGEKEVSGTDMKADMHNVTASRFYNDGAERVMPLSNFTSIDPVSEPLRIEQLIRVIPTTLDAVQYAETTIFDNLRVVITEAAIAGATTVSVENANGFFVNQPVTVRTNTGTFSTRIVGVDYGARTLTFASGLPAAANVNNPVVSQVFSGTPEGGLKPLMGLRQPILKTASVITLAHAIIVPRQVLADLPRLRSEIDDNLLNGLDINREYQILYGNGDDRNLSGILNHPGRQVYRQDSVTTGGVQQTRIDTIRRAATLTYAAYLPASTVMINPFDWQEIELTKDNDNRYIWTTVTDGGIERLWRLPITIAQTLQPGRVLMGDFRRGCTLHNREDGNIRMSESHGEQFLENMVTILAEERLVLTVERPQAFVEVVFTAAA